jgi:hypothetical protein
MSHKTDYWPIVVGVLALAFTVLSFWYMNWRRGKLRVGNIQHFGAGKALEGNADEKNVVVITLPLILFNTGARPLVVESLRLVQNSTDSLSVLSFVRVDDQITMTPQSNQQIISDYFFIPVLIKANEVVKGNFVFEARNSAFVFAQSKYLFNLETQISGCRGWRRVKVIELDFTKATDIELFNLNEFFSVFLYRNNENA